MISVIINVHNGAAFLSDAVDSVVAQSWTDWELVLWDNQSTDDTAGIFKSYDDPRFRYFCAPQFTPVCRARRLAVEKSRCDWLAFLDHDDLWLPDKLERQMALVSEEGPEPPGFVYGRALELYLDGRTGVQDTAHEYGRLPEGDIVRDLLTDGCFIAQSSVLISRRAYDSVGGWSDKVALSCDLELFLSLAHRFQVRAVQLPCCFYRRHTSNVSTTNRMKSLHETVLVLDAWQALAPPRARRVHETLLGLDEVKVGQAVKGIGRILRRGSVGWLSARLFVWVWRAVRRALKPSPWTRPPSHGPAGRRIRSPRAVKDPRPDA